MTEKLFEEIFNSDEENKNRADAVSGQTDSNGNIHINEQTQLNPQDERS